jgi:Flp pilus assembly protein TadG
MRPTSFQSCCRAVGPRRQHGVLVVEFALVALLFFTLLLGIMEFGRLMFTLNAATEATRLGARLAAVCDQNDPDIKTKMRSFLMGVSEAQIVLQYAPANCDASNCRTVEVSLVNASFTPLIPFMGAAIPLPSFITSLPREMMNSTDNPVCSY